MTMKVGFRLEAAYGTNPLTGADDYVKHFGRYLPKTEIPIPWHEIGLTPVYELGTANGGAPVELVEGAKDVTFKLSFAMMDAWMFKFLLGTITGGTTFTNSTTLPSFTTYIETDWDDVLVVKGCVLKSLDFYADKNELTGIEITVLGAEVAEHAKLVPSAGVTPRYDAALAITSAWGWGDNNAIKLDTTSIIGDGGEINRIHFHVENILKPRTSDKIVEIRKVGIGVELDFDIPMKLTTNLLVQAVRDEETNDFYYKWLRGAYYIELWVNNCKFRRMNSSQKVADGEQPVYTIAGSAVYDSTNTGFEDAIKFKAVDGVTYS